MTPFFSCAYLDHLPVVCLHVPLLAVVHEQPEAAPQPGVSLLVQQQAQRGQARVLGRDARFAGGAVV